jgi:DNA invertase Pin-like site-specific DNA recombinase
MPSSASAAALYLRSSKDRTDISPATQRRALEDLASSRSLAVTKIYEDAVESGSTEDRPAFSELWRDIRNPGRGWSFLLVYDTSRIARRRYIAQALKHEAKKRGITILYANRPADLDPVSELLLESVFEAMDEVHSITSRQKGLAGMAENVRRGWRAGGRAPLGYRLTMIPTGAIREGKPVTKSKLEPGDSAPAMREYLRARAHGMPRTVAARRCGLRCPSSTLVHLEWNALTYAGHTVWNVNRPHGAGTKRRPRSEWLVNRGTHQALISDREAEAIIAQLETSSIGQALRVAKAAQSSFLLSGLMFSPDGRMWVGAGDCYRLRRRAGLPGRKVRAELVDVAITGQIRALLSSDRYLEQLLEHTRKYVATAAPGADLEIRISRLERERQKAAEHALIAEHGEVYVSLVEQRGRQIDALRRELDAVQAEAAAGEQIRSLTLPQLRELVTVQEPAKAIRTLVERVMLGTSLHCQVRVRACPAPRRWLSVASPADADSWPPELTLPIAIGS